MKCIWCRSVQGESHKATNKICQDWSFASAESDIAVAIVCDGHGGERYFRSDIGSCFAGETTKAGLLEVASSLNPAIFAESQFIAVPKESDRTSDFWENHPEPTDVQRRTIEHLLGFIRNNWDVKIREHVLDNDLSIDEKNRLAEKYVTAFQAIQEDEPETYASFYGTTLMAYLQTSEYWLAFHLGDGKLVTLEKDSLNGNLIFREPIPEDANCFLNKTTSLCDSNSYNEIRYCFGGKDTKPMAVFLCSDGISDSWGSDEALYQYYARFLKQIQWKSVDDIIIDLPNELANLSQRGSGDDMSLACLFDDTQYPELYRLLLNWQINNTKTQLQQLRAESSTTPDFPSLEKAANDANTICGKLENELDSLSQKLNLLKEELGFTHNENETFKGKLSTAREAAEKSLYESLSSFVQSLFSSKSSERTRLEREITQKEKLLLRYKQNAEKAQKELNYQIRKSDERSAKITQLNETLKALEEDDSLIGPSQDNSCPLSLHRGETETGSPKESVTPEILRQDHVSSFPEATIDNTFAREITVPPISESPSEIKGARIFDRDEIVSQ